MRGTELLNKMALVDPAYIEEAEKKPIKKKHSLLRFGAAAACLCLAAVMIFCHRSEPALEKISIPSIESTGMGFEGYMYYSASELNNDNPWKESMELDTLPVYLNSAYDSSGTGTPKGLSEEEMKSALEAVVSALGAEVITAETVTDSEEIGVHISAELRAETDRGYIRIQSDGGIAYHPSEGLPDEYSFTLDSTPYSEAKRTVAYLTGIYGELLKMEKPEPVLWGDYDIYGEYQRTYEVYDSGGDDVEDILNYNFRRVSFFPENNGTPSLIIRISDRLKVSEKVGDYPIISVSEAKEKLLSGNYQTSVPYAMPGEEYIAKAELMYRTGRHEEMLLPYYRFYVLLPSMKTEENGLKTYGAYYVPAITDKYIENMPVYDGSFN